MLNDGDDEASRIRKLRESLNENSEPNQESGSQKPRQPKPSQIIENVQINGNGNIIGNNVYNIKTERPPRPRTIVKTGEGVITAQQKFELGQLVDEIVDIHRALKRSPPSKGAVWKLTHNATGVNSYHEIPEDRFEAAKNALLMRRATLLGMPSAPRKLGSDWRNSRMRSIHARSKKVPGLEEKRLAYMKRKFSAQSMTELSDNQLKQLYRYIMAFEQPT